MKNAPLKTIDEYFAGPDVHELQRQKPGGLIVFITAALVCIIENFLVYWLLKGQISVIQAAALHLAIVVILAIYTRLLLGSDAENRFALLLMLSTALTGPFGAGGVMLSIIMHHLLSAYALPFKQWFNSIFPTQPQSTAQRIYDDIRVGRDESAKAYSVIPFLDVLWFGSEVQKRQALSKMASNFHPSFAPAFKKALGDHSNLIRVQAATAITKIESQFMSRLMKLSSIREKNPDDPVVVLALAEHYDNYAYTGLLDFDREQTNRKFALEHYEEYLLLVPNNTEVRGRIGRILMREREYERALAWLGECIRDGHINESISQWYSEALFACGRYAELRRYRAAQRPAPVDATQTGLSESLLLWAGSKA